VPSTTVRAKAKHFRLTPQEPMRTHEESHWHSETAAVDVAWLAVAQDVRGVRLAGCRKIHSSWHLAPPGAETQRAAVSLVSSNVFPALLTPGWIECQ